MECVVVHTCCGYAYKNGIGFFYASRVTERTKQEQLETFIVHKMNTNWNGHVSCEINLIRSSLVAESSKKTYCNGLSIDSPTQAIWLNHFICMTAAVNYLP